MLVSVVSEVYITCSAIYASVQHNAVFHVYV